MESGIYKIRNILNDRCYIGSSNKIKRRKVEHIGKLRRNQHENSYLQRAWNKYGESNFIFEILELCSDSELLIKEQSYLDNVKKLYNGTRIAGGRFMAGRKMPEKQKELMRQLRTGVVVSEGTKNKLREINLGKTASEESKKKNSEISKANWKREEYKDLISKKRKETWSNEEFRKSQIEKITVGLNNSETKNKISIKSKEWWSNEKNKKSNSQKIKEGIKNSDKFKNRNVQNKFSYIITDLISNITKEIVGAENVCKELNIGSCTVSRICKGGILRNQFKIQRKVNEQKK